MASMYRRKKEGPPLLLLTFFSVVRGGRGGRRQKRPLSAFSTAVTIFGPTYVMCASKVIRGHSSKVTKNYHSPSCSTYLSFSNVKWAKGVLFTFQIKANSMPTFSSLFAERATNCSPSFFSLQVRRPPFVPGQVRRQLHHHRHPLLLRRRRRRPLGLPGPRRL